MAPLPETFAGSRDTVSAAGINWRTFFSDPMLNRLIDSALLNNQDLRMALQRIKAAEAEVLRSRAALKPNLNANITPAIRRYGLYTMDGAGNASTFIQPGKIVPVNLPDYYLGLQSAWEVDLWGKLRNRREANLARLLATTEGRHLLTTQLVAEIATTYYALEADDQMLNIIDETIVLQENAVGILRVQKEAAAANQLAVEQFEAQLIGFRAMRAGLQQDVADNEMKLNLLLGQYPRPIPRDTAAFLSRSIPVISTGVPAALLQYRPDIREATWKLEASKADVAAARAAFYPSLNITAALGYQAFQPNLLFTTPESMAYALVAGFSAPLLNRAGLKAEFNAANARQVEALYQYQKSVLTGFLEVHNEMKRMNNLQQVFEQRRQQVAVLTKSIETAAALFRSGRATYLELLVNQQNALQARLDMVIARMQQLQTTVNLYKALGGGWQ
jgi:NodT family efflux transporter outer membrane factor (OMF) lipoprotein